MRRATDTILNAISSLSANLAAGPAADLCAKAASGTLAGTAFAGVLPVAGPVVAVVGLLALTAGSTFVQVCRAKRADDKQRGHLLRIEKLLRRIEANQNDEAPKRELADIAQADLAQQSPNVAAAAERGPDELKAALQPTAEEVATALNSLGAGIADIQETLRHFIILEFDTNQRVRVVERQTHRVKHTVIAVGLVLLLAGVVSAVLLGNQGRRTQATQDVANARLAKLEAKLGAFFESQKSPGVDPTTIPVPADVLAAAQELLGSKNARQRASAAIVLKQWDEAKRQIDQLNASAATREVFQNKTLEGDFYYAQGRYDDAIGPYEAAFALRQDDVTARNNLALALSSARLGDLTLKRKRAIEIYSGTLALPVLSRADWAMTQNNMGTAWADLPTGDRAENLGRAIACYTEALKERTREISPLDWAATRSNMGSALAQMPAGDHAENLTRAIDAFSDALKEYTQEATPMEWAVTQNNLGNAWQGMPTGDDAENLARAIAAYTEALKGYTREAAPMYWAGTQSNLGLAWAQMPTGDRAENLERAVACYAQALEELTHKAAPLEWATTQFNRGIALFYLAKEPGQDACGLLGRAIACFKAALIEYTPEASPQDHADTTRNLAVMRQRYEALGCHEGPGGVPFDGIEPAP